MTTTGTPDWIRSQRRASGLCQRCGTVGAALVTWAASGQSWPVSGTEELLCGTCWEAGEQALREAYDARITL